MKKGGDDKLAHEQTTPEAKDSEQTVIQNLSEKFGDVHSKMPEVSRAQKDFDSTTKYCNFESSPEKVALIRMPNFDCVLTKMDGGKLQDLSNFLDGSFIAKVLDEKGDILISSSEIPWMLRGLAVDTLHLFGITRKFYEVTTGNRARIVALERSTEQQKKEIAGLTETVSNLQKTVHELSQRLDSQDSDSSSASSVISGTDEALPTKSDMHEQLMAHEGEIMDHTTHFHHIAAEMATFRQQLEDFLKQKPAAQPAAAFDTLTAEIADLRKQIQSPKPRPSRAKFATNPNFLVIKSNSNLPTTAIENLRARGQVLSSNIYTSPTGLHTAFVKLTGPDAESLIRTAGEWAPAADFAVVPYEIRPPRPRTE